MIYNSELTQERLQEVAHYDIHSGIFTARRGRARRKEGEELGTIRQDGYRAIMVDGKWYRAHRLAWLYVYGEFPDTSLDHANRDKLDNRILNLRPATDSQNYINKGLRKNNTTGATGIYPVSRQKGTGYTTYIYKDGKKTSLGTFDTPEEAQSVRLKAANDLYGEFAEIA